MNFRKSATTSVTDLILDTTAIGGLDIENLSCLFSEFPDPVIGADNQRMIVFLNHAAEKLLGCSLGQKDSPPTCKEILKTEIGGRRACFVEHCLSHNENLSRVPVRLRNCHGDWLSLCVTATVIRNGRGGAPAGCFAVLRDTRADLMAQSETSAKIATLESLLDNFPTPFFTVSRDLVITHMNESLEKLSGYSKDKVIGRMTCASVLSSPHCNTPGCLLKQSMENRNPIAEVTRMVRNRDGREIPVVASASIITDRSGRVIGGFEAFRDISSVVKAQKEVEETRLQIIQAEKIASLGRLAAGVAHEINNPLAGILIHADMLMREISGNPRWHQDLELIISQTERCKHIVSNLLQFSRQTFGHRIPTDVNNLICHCVKLLAYQAMFHNVEIIQELQTGLPRIMADHGQLHQVFANLIINAGDAMHGKGRLIISSKFDPQTKQVFVKFADTGDGIPGEIMDKIFEPFFTTKPPGKGTGLGLSIAYGIIQQHGGSIEAKSLPLGGSTFTVNLPVEYAEDQSEIVQKERFYQ